MVGRFIFSKVAVHRFFIYFSNTLRCVYVEMNFKVHQSRSGTNLPYGDMPHSGGKSNFKGLSVIRRFTSQFARESRHFCRPNRFKLLKNIDNKPVTVIYFFTNSRRFSLAFAAYIL